MVNTAQEGENPFILAHTTHEASLPSEKVQNSETVKRRSVNVIVIIIILHIASFSFTSEFLPNLTQYNNRAKALKSGVKACTNKIGPLVLAGGYI